VARLLLLNKPFEVMCQFTDREGRRTLADFIPLPDVYPAGRLDYDSEGLVVLTDDGRLQAAISDPAANVTKTYWVQVERLPDKRAVDRLRGGVKLGDGMTAPARARLIDEPDLWPRVPPVRYRANVPSAWLELGISEGRNRQVRRMTAAVGHPTLRLVRVAVGPWRLGRLGPGEWLELPFPDDWPTLLSPPAPGTAAPAAGRSRQRRRAA
jgi:23S rRNA pseudouridine2457 synthase